MRSALPRAAPENRVTPAAALKTRFADPRGAEDELLIWEDLLEQSDVCELHGLPFPVQFRNQGAFPAWWDAFDRTATGRALWRSWSLPQYAVGDAIGTLARMLQSQVPDGPDAGAGRQHMRSLAVRIGLNLLFQIRHASLIEVTPALETLLAHSDLHAALPIGMLAPPFAAQYVRFGGQAATLLPCALAYQPGDRIDGVFCFAAPAPARSLQFSFIIKRGERYCGHILLEHPVVDPGQSLEDWVRQLARTSKLERLLPERLTDLLNYVAKVFLYMGLKTARSVALTEHSAANQRLAGIGPKKKARFARRMASLYDHILVGPAHLPASERGAGCAHALAPHWRRGHFRMQTHGAGGRDRKLIFVAPVMVRADLLGAEAPPPKAYRAST